MVAKNLVTTRNPQYAQGNINRLGNWVAIALALLVPLTLALGINEFFLGEGTPDLARQLAYVNPRTLMGSSEDTQHFLPAPVPVIPAETRPVQQAPIQQARVANTGGAGAVLRAEPETGRQVASLGEGELIQVLEKQPVGDTDWLHVRTPKGAEGWISGKLVTPTG